ncbi:hypothetical protein DFA_08936 [Cavenderia fasciculata]|uniref:Uncharacterized protein n=1 Tax=Cavenderia fasciculata TaxID=261658 RepID=F4Q542_CACFS|nr:uncharacterized protein DFA_08936 [Cavenderia fasciculata]EGG17935.1 hypothetical protein DFA_08936 [Cavenderia fasciculata]|eukprot:XP_004356419.1 hypothetical protein DFA_08936 [Cavenderia fasciculata]
MEIECSTLFKMGDISEKLIAQAHDMFLNVDEPLAVLYQELRYIRSQDKTSDEGYSIDQQEALEIHSDEYFQDMNRFGLLLVFYRLRILHFNEVDKTVKIVHNLGSHYKPGFSLAEITNFNTVVQQIIRERQKRLMQAVILQ